MWLTNMGEGAAGWTSCCLTLTADQMIAASVPLTCLIWLSVAHIYRKGWVTPPSPILPTLIMERLFITDSFPFLLVLPPPWRDCNRKNTTHFGSTFRYMRGTFLRSLHSTRSIQSEALVPLLYHARIRTCAS